MVIQRSLAALIALALSGCLSDGKRDGTVDSETHFLVTCDSDSACVQGRECICGVCSVPCGSTDACEAISGLGSCVDAVDVSGCGEGPAVTLCLALCDDDAACGSDGLACVDGLCINANPEPPTADVVDDTTVADTAPTDTTQPDTAEADTTPADGVEADTGPTAPVACQRCGSETGCPDGEICGPNGGSDEPGAIPGLACEPLSDAITGQCQDFCQAACAGLECGAGAAGCICGTCAPGDVCDQGSCAAEDACPGSPCVDIAGVQACPGTSYEAQCELMLGEPAGNIRSCLCTDNGPVCEDCQSIELGPNAEVGESCLPPATACVTANCWQGTCLPSCSVDSDCPGGACSGGVCTAEPVGCVGCSAPGDLCTDSAECAGGLPCTLGLCGEACQGGDGTCPASARCFVPGGSLAGVCVAACDRCGDACAGTDQVCTAVGQNYTFACIPRDYSPGWHPPQLCADACTIACSTAGVTCGALDDGCTCGVCGDGESCDGGSCVASGTCPTTCDDAFGSAVCAGGQAARLCQGGFGDVAPKFEACTCGNDGQWSCGGVCGSHAVAGGAPYGSACSTGADCATAECTLGVCAPPCYIEADNGPLFGCPTGFECNVPGAASGYCLETCTTSNNCRSPAECLPSQLGEPGNMVCREPK